MAGSVNFVYETCLSVPIDVERDSFSVDVPWIVGAFFLGLFVGGGITAFCVPPLLKSWEKRKKQDEEELLKEQAEFGDTSNTRSGVLGTEVFMVSENRKSKLGHREKDGSDQTEVDPSLTRGMADVIVQPTTGSSEAEMTDQDLQYVIGMEKDFDKEKDFMFQRLLRMKLKKLKDKGRITEPYMESFMQRIVDDMKNSRKIVEDEKKEAEEELRNKHSKDSLTLNNELEILESQNSTKLSNLRKEEHESLRQDLLKAGLSEAEVDTLMEKLMQELSEAERKFELEQARQARALEERLARRRQIVELQNLQNRQQEEEINIQRDGFETPLNTHVEHGQFTEKQKKELLDTYENDLQKIQSQHKKDLMRHQAELAAKLKQRRLKHMQELAEKQAKDKAQFLHTAEKGTDTAQFIKGCHQLTQQHHAETDVIQIELDDAEVQDLDKIKTQHDAQRTRAIEERKDRLVDTIQSSAQLTGRDVDRIISAHKKQMTAFQARRKEDKERMAAKLQEKWNIKMKQMQTDEENMAMEQEALAEQQQTTVKKVLASNMDLTDDTKERILKEHERNMHALNSQLQHSRLRQQKSLEHKLSQRRAHIAELKQKQEMLKRLKAESKQKDAEKQQQLLATQIQDEEKRLEKERLTSLDQLRKRLNVETEQALKQQEAELGTLIGRLQVGHARRQAVLEKQDVVLQQLQEELEKKLEEGDSVSQSWADQIIQQHYNEVEHLNAQIQVNRERHEQVLQEKIQTKQFKKKKEIESQMHEEAQEEYYSQRQRGAGIASAVLNQMLLEQRHQRAIAEIEHDMKIDLDRSKNELYNQLQHELEQELQEQKQNLLQQLAAASNLSTDELNEAVTAAVSGTGGNQKIAKKLARELQTGINRAKSSMGMNESDEELIAPAHQRPKSAFTTGRDVGDWQTPQDENSLHTGTTKKKRVPKAKKAFAAPDEMTNEITYGIDEDF